MKDDRGGHGMRKLVFVICFGVLFILAACGEDEETEEVEDAEPTPVEVGKVEKGDFNIKKTMYGNTTPKKQQPVTLEQPGEVTTLKVKNGDKVKKNDHLATVKTPTGDIKVEATTDGTIAQLSVSEGSMASNEDPLLIIADLDTLMIQYQVTAKARDLFKEDKELSVTIDGEKYKAKVTSIDAMPGESGQYAVELELDNKDEDVLVGEPAQVSVTEKKVKKTKIVPTEAIITEGDEKFVYVVHDDEVERVFVEVEETQTKESAVKADELKADDEVVVNGHFTLTEDAKVTVQKEED